MARRLARGNGRLTGCARRLAEGHLDNPASYGLLVRLPR
jgi:hypothetical protein